MPVYIADRRLWLTVDGKVVEDGDPKAHSLLLSGPGKKLPEVQARALGLMDEPVDTVDEGDLTSLSSSETELAPEIEPELEPEPELELQETSPPPASRRRREVAPDG